MLSDTTVVTAFYPLKKSKHAIGKYRAWIQNFCKIPCAMVIFTTEIYALEIYQWRRQLLNQTHIIVRPFDTFAMTCPAMMSLWEKQVALDTSQDKNACSPELYAVWALKQELVRIAIRANSFQSKWFIWCDIGIQRYKGLQMHYMSFPSETARLCEEGRLSFLEVESIPKSFVDDWHEEKPMAHPIPKVCLGGGCIAGDAVAWEELGEAYKAMLQEFVVREWFAGNDRDIFFAIMMERKMRFRLFYAKPFGDNAPPGIEWMSFPPMLGGMLAAEEDMRFTDPGPHSGPGPGSSPS